MPIHAALHHVTHYQYDRLVGLGPQTIRLRPAPHCRSNVISYSLKVEPAQQTIPGVDAEPVEPEGWANKTVKRVIIETFAHEVKRADHEAQRAASTGDDVAERVARARAAERQNLIEELRLAGFTAEPSTGDDDITVMELDFDLATDEEVAVDDEDDEPEESEECPTDADADVAPEPEPEPEDPTKHPALAGAISTTKAKRAERKADAKPKGRGRGGKK